MTTSVSKHASEAPSSFAHRIPVLAPITGRARSLASSIEPLIAMRACGDGVCIEVSGSQLFTPFEGTILQFAETGETLVLKANNGLILRLAFSSVLHQLMGERIRRHVRSGDNVTAKQCLMDFDLAFLRSQLTRVELYVTVLNGAKLRAITTPGGPDASMVVVANDDDLMTLFF